MTDMFVKMTDMLFFCVLHLGADLRFNLLGWRSTFATKFRMQKILVILRLLKTHNIGTHLKGIETSFQVVPLFFKSFHFWASYITF
jgi:hypothetical protein